MSASKSGKYVSNASRQPANMMGFLPILSDSQPKNMNPGVASAKAIAVSILVVAPSTRSILSRKNKA